MGASVLPGGRPGRRAIPAAAHHLATVAGRAPTASAADVAVAPESTISRAASTASVGYVIEPPPGRVVQ